MILRFLLVLLICGASVARADVYKIDNSHSRITFSVRHLLGTARGEFRKFDGQIDIDRAHPEHSSVTARIDVVSIDTKIRKRDDHLLSAEFFDPSRFPDITFQSHNIKRISDNTADIGGAVTIKGVTRNLTLHARLVAPADTNAAPERTRWQITSEPIRRKDFGLVFSSTAERISGIGQDVAVAFEIEAVRQ